MQEEGSVGGNGRMTGPEEGHLLAAALEEGEGSKKGLCVECWPIKRAVWWPRRSAVARERLSVGFGARKKSGSVGQVGLKV